jgi:hypothetical protein
MNDIMDGEPSEKFDILNCIAWLVIVFFAGLFWPIAMLVAHYHDGNLDYCLKKGFRII